MLNVLLPIVFAVALTGASPSERIYATSCATCHGAQQQGTANGPSLRRAGMADLDFYLSTGRMPAETPWVQVAHRDERAGQQLPLAQRRELEAYLAPVVAGGPPLPEVRSGSNLARGKQLYESNCEQCHAVGGNGGSIGRADWAPALQQASITEVADAVRAGPGQMPRFGERQIPPDALDDLAGYVLTLQQREPGATGIPLRSTGPVPEGALGYAGMIVLIVFVFGMWRRDKT